MNLLPAVMVRVPHQQEKVDRWLAYAKSINPEYDVDVLDAPPDDDTTPFKQDISFRHALDEYAGHPFLWVEPDSIPFPGWLERISQEYHEARSPFLLPEIHSQADIGSGIGVYPPNAHQLIPRAFNVHAWDAWVYRNMQDKTHYTKTIQHSYGQYNGFYMERRHAFPKDIPILNTGRAIFHSDPLQSLIRRMPTFYHTGDIGDLVAILPIVKQAGGGEIIIGKVDRKNLPFGKVPRSDIYDIYDQIVPLLEMQDYVTGVSSGDCEPDFDFSSFRLIDHLPHESLLQWQARAVGLGPIDESPWLKCGTYNNHQRVVIARSQRYHNPFFPWKAIVDYYGSRLLFVGTKDEHIDFQAEVTQPIEYANTPTLLDAAKVIMGAKIVFCNQSAPFWIAAGLGKPLVQECWVGGHLNSIVKRNNASYITTDTTSVAKLLNIPL